MPSAFLQKKPLLDRLKDDYGFKNPLKRARTARSWDNPILRHQRERGIQSWASSFAGKRHYRKLARFNALHNESVAYEKLSYEKDHVNAKGEKAPWVIRSHDDNRVLASFASKKDAQRHLARMAQYAKGESMSLRDVLNESRLKKLEGQTPSTQPSEENGDSDIRSLLKAAASSAWSSSGASDFKLDMAAIKDRVEIAAKGPDGKDSIGIMWRIIVPDSGEDILIKQYADWGAKSGEPERIWSVKDLDALESSLEDEFRALQDTLDISKQ